MTVFLLIASGWATLGACIATSRDTNSVIAKAYAERVLYPFGEFPKREPIARAIAAAFVAGYTDRNTEACYNYGG